MRLNELKKSSTVANNLEQFIVSQHNLGKTAEQIEASLNDWVTDMMTGLSEADTSDFVFNSLDMLLENAIDYDPYMGYSVNDTSLQELNRTYLNGELSMFFSDSAIAAGQLYLQGSPATRTPDGLIDAVTKAMYGSSAEFDDISGTKKEFVKANVGVALAQFTQYKIGEETFARDGLSFKSVNIDGYGLCAIDSEGYFYIPMSGDSTCIGYIGDKTYRDQILRGGSNAVIDLADPRISKDFYRRQHAEQPESVPDIPLSNDSFFIVDKDIVSERQAKLMDHRGPYKNVWEDQIFIGLRDQLKRGKKQNAV